MSETIDLGENAEEFLQYTADKAYGDLIALQGHLESIIKGERERFCLACSLKHEISLSKLGEECLTGLCPSQPIWRDMAKWATDSKERSLKLLKNNQGLSRDEALKLAEEARHFRKEMEKILVGDKKAEGKHLGNPFPKELEPSAEIARNYPRAIDEAFMESVLGTNEVRLIKKYYPNLKSFWKAAQKEDLQGGDKMKDKHFGNPETKHLGEEDTVLLDLEKGEIREGGIVVNEERALASPCHGYNLDGEKRLVFSEGIVGALDKYEQEKYCKAGLDLKPPPPRLAARIKALREAGVHFRKKT